jgi:hypothetical protein
MNLSLDKMLSGVNALEINDIQERKTDARVVREDQDVTMLHAVENHRIQFLRTTG